MSDPFIPSSSSPRTRVAALLVACCLGPGACAAPFTTDWMMGDAYEPLMAASNEFCASHDQLFFHLGRRGDGWDVVGLCGCGKTTVVAWDGQRFSPAPHPSDGAWKCKSNCREWGWPTPDACGRKRAELADDPEREAKALEESLPTSCDQVDCPPSKVCRLLSLSDDDPHAVARAICLGPDDGLCQTDPELCTDEICRTQPGVCP